MFLGLTKLIRTASSSVVITPPASSPHSGKTKLIIHGEIVLCNKTTAQPKTEMLFKFQFGNVSPFLFRNKTIEIRFGREAETGAWLFY
jgi:hypothetical protein